MRANHLLDAITNKRIARALELIKNGHPLNNIPEGSDISYLLATITTGWDFHHPELSLTLVKILCEAGSDVHYQNKKLSVFVAAVMLTQDQALISYLQERGANFDHPILKAAWMGDQDKFNELIAHAEQKDSFNNSVLHYAVFGGKLDFVKWLLQKNLPNLSISIANERGYTPLHIACRNDNLELVQSLLSAGASLSETSKFGATGIHFAAEALSGKVLQWLVEAKQFPVSTPITNGETALYFTVRNGNLATVNYLLEHGSNLTEKNNENEGVLHWAVLRDDLNLLKLFVEKGANLWERDNLGLTCAHLAAKEGCLELFKFILQLDNSLAQAKTNQDETPIILAASSGHLDIVNYLLRSIPNIDRLDNGFFLIHFLILKGAPVEAIQYLVKEHGASLSQKTENQREWTPLILAIKFKRLNIFQWILETYPDEVINNESKVIQAAVESSAVAKNIDMRVIEHLLEFYTKQKNEQAKEALFHACTRVALNYNSESLISWLINKKQRSIFVNAELLDKLEPAVIDLLISSGARIEQDLSSLAKINPLSKPGETHTLETLKHAIENGVEFNIPALRRAIDYRLDTYPKAKELSTAFDLFSKYLRLQKHHPTFTLQEAHTLTQNGFSLFFTAKQKNIFPQDILIEIVSHVTKLSSTRVVEIFNAVMERIFATMPETNKQLRL